MAWKQILTSAKCLSAKIGSFANNIGENEISDTDIRNFW